MGRKTTYAEEMMFAGIGSVSLRVTGFTEEEEGVPVTFSVRGENGVNVAPETEWHLRRDTKGKIRKCGYTLMIPEIASLMEKTDRLSLCAEAAGRKQTVAVWSVQKLKKKWKKESLRLQVDGCSESGGQISVQGWILSFSGKQPELKIQDMRGEEMPFHVTFRRRVDLEQQFFLSRDVTPGFWIKIDAAEVKSSAFWIVCRENGAEIRRKISPGQKQPVHHGGNIRHFMKPVYIRRAWQYLQRNGARALIKRVRRGFFDQNVQYAAWFAQNRVTEETIEKQKAEQETFSCRPKISICIPLFNTRIPFLEALLSSVNAQSYPNWELCLADGSTDDAVGLYVKEFFGEDRRVRYERLSENFGIAGNTNYAIQMATGDFVMLTDHDDFLEPDALFEIVKRINEKPDTDIVYTDEDLTDAEGVKFHSPRFKPDYNPDFLCSINYICHIFAVRRSIMQEVGGFREEMDGAQDWDMILRCCEKTEHIEHIARVLYHWRAHEESTAGNPESKQYAVDAGRRAVQEHFRRCHEEAQILDTGIFILFQPVIKVQGTPKVSIIICNKDQADTLKTCLDSIEQLSTYPNYEVIVVENNSTEEKTFAYYEELGRSDRVKVVTFTEQIPFNYSRLNNFGASFAEGEYLILLNNDTKVITPDWIERMLGYCQRENTGAVGAKLYYEDKTVQHCGVVIGLGGFAGHVETNTMPEDTGYFGRLKAVQDISAVTAACMMIKKSVFEEIGGLDEAFTVALNDVDLCMRIRKAGYRIVLNPAVELYHFESKSRGYEETPEKHARFKREIAKFRDRWKKELDEEDPYYSPHLTLMYGDCRIRQDDEYSEIVEEIEQDQKTVSKSSEAES